MKLFSSKPKRKRTLKKSPGDPTPVKKNEPKPGRTRHSGSEINMHKKSIRSKSIRRKSARVRHRTNRPMPSLSLKHYIYGSILLTGALFITVALRAIIGGLVEDAAARSEYEQLREYSPAASTPAVTGNTSTDNSRDINEGIADIFEEDVDEEDEAEAEYLEMQILSFDELAAMNRDFIGWINVNPHIDYPVVRGSDNSKYINTTFLGNRNTAGTIFMDYRNVNNFDEEISILYGHNTRDGAMFSQLSNYLNPDFQNRNPNIIITTREGKSLTYKIFAAKITDAWDVAYTIGVNGGAGASDVFPNVPENASRFLLLSTCTRSSDDDERILVFAAIT